MSSSITLRIRQATGLRSLANASQPSRRPPAGSSRRQRTDPRPAAAPRACAAFTSAAADLEVGAVRARSQFAKSAMNLSSALRRSSSVVPGVAAGDLPQELPRLRLELRRAQRIARVRPEERRAAPPGTTPADAAPTRDAACRMPVTDRLLPRRVPRHLGDREVHLGEALAVLGDHESLSVWRGSSRSSIGFVIAFTDR